jgi:hypothetical protein
MHDGRWGTLGVVSNRSDERGSTPLCSTDFVFTNCPDTCKPDNTSPNETPLPTTPYLYRNATLPRNDLSCNLLLFFLLLLLLLLLHHPSTPGRQHRTLLSTPNLHLHLESQISLRSHSRPRSRDRTSSTNAWARRVSFAQPHSAPSHLETTRGAFLAQVPFVPPPLRLGASRDRIGANPVERVWGGWRVCLLWEGVMRSGVLGRWKWDGRERASECGEG